MKILTLDEIFADDTLSQAFDTYLQTEFGIESLLFINDVRAWKKVYFDVPAKANRARAKKIYATYIAPGSVLEINVAEGLKREVAVAVQSRVDVAPELFDNAVTELSQLLNGGAVLRFARSRAYADLEGGKTRVVSGLV